MYEILTTLCIYTSYVVHVSFVNFFYTTQSSSNFFATKAFRLQGSGLSKFYYTCTSTIAAAWNMQKEIVTSMPRSAAAITIAAAPLGIIDDGTCRNKFISDLNIIAQHRG